MNVKRHLLGLSLCALASAGVAATPACQPVIEQAWVRAPPPGAMVMAGYATIRNPCGHAIAVTDVSGDDFSTAMIHETMTQNGMSQMRHVGALMIRAKGQTQLTPGGAHLMLMQPKRQFREGDKTRLSLKLADGRVVSANFYVRLDPRGK